MTWEAEQNIGFEVERTGSSIRVYVLFIYL